MFPANSCNKYYELTQRRLHAGLAGVEHLRRVEVDPSGERLRYVQHTRHERREEMHRVAQHLVQTLRDLLYRFPRLALRLGAFDLGEYRLEDGAEEDPGYAAVLLQWPSTMGLTSTGDGLRVYSVKGLTRSLISVQATRVSSHVGWFKYLPQCAALTTMGVGHIRSWGWPYWSVPIFATMCSTNHNGGSHIRSWGGHVG